MKHKYKINGATCENCGKKVSNVIGKIEGVTKAISPEKGILEVEMNKHVDTEVMNDELQNAGYEKYSLETLGMNQNHEGADPKKSWKDYKPLILVVSYILIGTVLGMNLTGDWSLIMGMRLFMGLFFLIFSFFKMLDLQGFAMSYISYDIVAAKWMKWGYIYPFIELIFGLGYLTGWQPLYLNVAVALVMGVSLIGVVKSVLNKRQIQCVCLGTGFNLPMSTVTIIEDAAMVLMAVWMILNLL